jgi:hypothetical protein
MVQGKAYDICCVGSSDAEGALMLYPHETAYEIEGAIGKFAAYLKQVAQEGEAPVDALDLLHHQRAAGVNLVLVSESMLEVNDQLYQVPRTRKVKKNFSSDFIYGKLEAVLPKVRAATASAKDSAQAQAAPAVEGPSMITMSPVKSAPPDPPRKDPAARKPLRITTVTQGSGAQDSLAAKLAEMEKSLGVRAGRDGGGLKAAVIMSARKTGAVLLNLNQMTDDEITERDSMALAGGGTPAPKTAGTAVQHIALPKKAAITPESMAADDPLAGIDLDTEADLAELANAFDEAPVTTPAAAPRPSAPRPVAKPVTVMSGDEAEQLASSTAALSDNAQMALRVQRVESRAVDLVGDDVVELFSSASAKAQVTQQDSAELAEQTQTLTHGGRQIQKTGVANTGRGGTRPITAKDKARGK